MPQSKLSVVGNSSSCALKAGKYRNVRKRVHAAASFAVGLSAVEKDTEERGKDKRNCTRASVAIPMMASERLRCCGREWEKGGIALKNWINVCQEQSNDDSRSTNNKEDN